MFTNSVSLTSLLTAAARSKESVSSCALITDPCAEILSGELGRHMLERVGEDFIAIVAVRTKYFDSIIENAVSRGINQFIVLGSGLDSRPYRLSFLPSSGLWFEFDYKSVLDYKKRILDATHYQPFIPIKHVPYDILKVNLVQQLVINGFDVKKPTLLIIEGVIYYLTLVQVDSLFEKIANAFLTLHAPFEILFDASDKELIKPNFYTRQILELLNSLNAPLVFEGIDEPENFIRNYGFIPYEIVFLGHKKAHYGRLSFGPYKSLPYGYPTSWFIHCYGSSKK